MNNSITVTADVKAPIALVWDLWTTPEHIMNWNNATEDWYTPQAKIDFQVGGWFSYTMASKDGKNQFDLKGKFTTIKLENPEREISYELEDGRKVTIHFCETSLQKLQPYTVGTGPIVNIRETFDPEGVNPIEMQRQGWQAILDNFKKYAEQIANKNT